ncbi:MAG: beta-N-acetylhexosaminidase [Verrucomicrobiae bacterium]|nr:beta-N-acetylhexosaminidase [Verrucomicrobiae bacterium]
MKLELGQLLTMGLPGPRLNDTYRDFIKKVQPGGFILFGRNLQSPQQVRELCDELRSLCERPPILTIDQEGGRVSRLKEIGEQPPSADQLRQANQLELIERHGKLTAQLLNLFGLNLNLAPVVDILLDSSAENSLLNRCYGKNADEVIQKAGTFLDTMQKEGVHGTIKHFPGYSLCSKDPHRSLPIVNRSLTEMENNELKPFKALAPKSSAIMIGHAVYPQLSSDNLPSSLSPQIIQKLLREKMNYQGLIITDDLEMGAISFEYGIAQTVRLAIQAGNDLLLFCHQRECVEIAWETLKQMAQKEDLETPLHRLLTFKKKLCSVAPWNQKAFETINAEVKTLRETVEKLNSY